MRMFLKNAIAALALIGGLFASCAQEDLTTIYTPDPTTVNFAVSVVNSLTGENVSEKAVITGNKPIVNEAGIPAQEVTISAEYNGAKGSSVVKVAPLKKGGQATYNVNIILLGDEWTLVETSKTDSVYVSKIQNLNHGAAPFAHDGGTWFENATEYFMPVTVTYGYKNEFTTPSKFIDRDLLGQGAADAWEMLLDKTIAEASKKPIVIQPSDKVSHGEAGAVLSHDGILVNHQGVGQNGLYIYHDGTVVDHKGELVKITDDLNARVFTYTASAWSLSRPNVTYTTTTTEYSVESKVTGKQAAAFTLVQQYSSIACDYEEIAHPNHASHYVQHQGHNPEHGSSNAGGGIVLPD